MTLYVPSGSESVISEKYRKRFWSASCGYNNTDAHRRCALNMFRRTVELGWHPDPDYVETGYCCGGHGGCLDCIMVLSQVLANHNTEITLISDPPEARIFIDGNEWWPGALTQADGVTFIGIAPSMPHTYELRKEGYVSKSGTFNLSLDVPTTVTESLISPIEPPIEPPIFSIIIESTPSNATVTVDQVVQ